MHCSSQNSLAWFQQSLLLSIPAVVFWDCLCGLEALQGQSQTHHTSLLKSIKQRARIRQNQDEKPFVT